MQWHRPLEHEPFIFIHAHNSKMCAAMCLCLCENTIFLAPEPDYVQNPTSTAYSVLFIYTSMLPTTMKACITWIERCAAATCDAEQALATASQIFNPKMKQIKLIRISTKVNINTERMRTHTQAHTNTLLPTATYQGSFDWIEICQGKRSEQFLTLLWAACNLMQLSSRCPDLQVWCSNFTVLNIFKVSRYNGVILLYAGYYVNNYNMLHDDNHHLSHSFILRTINLKISHASACPFHDRKISIHTCNIVQFYFPTKDSSRWKKFFRSPKMLELSIVDNIEIGFGIGQNCKEPITYDPYFSFETLNESKCDSLYQLCAKSGHLCSTPKIRWFTDSHTRRPNTQWWS